MHTKTDSEAVPKSGKCDEAAPLAEKTSMPTMAKTKSTRKSTTSSWHADANERSMPAATRRSVRQ